MERRPKFDWHPSPRRPRCPSSVTSSSSAFSSRLPSFSSDAGDSFVTAEDERESSVSSNEAIAGGYGGRSAVQFVVPTTTRLAWWRRKPLYYLPNVPEEYRLETHSGVLRRFSLRELQVATDNFSRNNQLGRGCLGIVYKGQLADGSLVAVKRLNDPYIRTEPQFQKELISLKHKNLLILQGFCMTPTERFLVYPYMANRSLAHQLRGRLPTELPLDWPTRIQIALGSARGLSYLHDHCDPKIIHRDVKASKILLDEEFEAVLGHFRLAELIDCKDTHVTTTIRGTSGHIAPEYLLTGECSEKTDVFGYGIMLLELITGQRTFDLARLANDDDVMLLDWVKGLLDEERLDMLVDPELQDNYIEAEVEFAVQFAILCSQGSPIGRPKMSEVVRILEGEDLTERWEEWKKAKEWKADSTENLDSMELSSPR